MNGINLISGGTMQHLNAMLPGLMAAFILLRIAKWRIFAKAGIPGWKSLIPIYEGYLTFKIALRGWLYGICVIASAAALAFASIPGKKSGALELCSVIVDFTAVGLRVGVLTFLADRFGKGSFFMTGIVVFSQFFLMWLAFDKNSVYQGNPAEHLPPGKSPRAQKETT